MPIGTPVKSNCSNQAVRCTQAHRYINAVLATATLSILIGGLVAPTLALGQTGSVHMTFSDRDSFNNPFADSKAVLASGTSPIQESDFEPEPSVPPIVKAAKDPSVTPRRRSDDGIEILQLDSEKETEDPIETLEIDGEKKIDEPIQTLQPDKKETDEPAQTLPLDDKKETDEPTQTLQLDEEQEPGDPAETLQLDEKEEPDDPNEKLESDEPVEAPEFNLTDETPEESSPASTDRNDSAQSVQQSFGDDYQLPAVADVRAQISPAPLANTSQSDPGGLLNSGQDSTFSQTFVGPNSGYSEISGIPSAAKFKTWRAHNVYHRPTYFEDQNLELNGNRRPYQNIASAVSFFSTIPRIPYLIGEHHPREKIYTFGEDRPGDAAPFRVFESTGNKRGRVFQTIATLGLILP